MKRMAAMLAAVCLLCLVGYSGQENINPDAASVPAFSYEETLQSWKKSDPGVKTNGFQNTSELMVSTSQQAIERAENECTIEYSATAVAYDSEVDIWRVTFFTEDSVGNSQEVYLDGTGMTTLIIYGE